MLPLIPIIGWAVGGIAAAIGGAAAISVACEDDDEFDSFDWEANEREARVEAERKAKAARKRAAARRRKARQDELKGQLDRIRERDAKEIATARAEVRRNKSRLSKLTTLADDLESLCA